MTNEEAKKRLEVWLKCVYCPEEKKCYDSYLHSTCEYTDYCDAVSIEEAIKVAIKDLEQEPCEDAISRQAVLDLVNADWKYEGLEESINSLPPVTPQPKMGQWLSCVEEYGKPVKWVCSSCRHTKSITKNKTEYCPVCGARMGMTDKEIVDKLTELTTGSIDPLDLKDAMDLLCEIKRILSRRDRSE